MLDPISANTSKIEDTLFDLKTMIRFGLHMTENCTEEEFGTFRSDWCTLMYLLLDKIKAADDATGQVELAARATSSMETMQ